MKIQKATVVIDSSIYKADVIEFEGRYWLVPEWLDMPAQGVSMPRRIISLEAIPHQHTPGVDPEFVVNVPVPRAVFEGRAQSQGERQFVVRELPEIRVPLLKKMN
jgi:hypothetical protein